MRSFRSGYRTLWKNRMARNEDMPKPRAFQNSGVRMVGIALHHPYGKNFDPFLQAYVGEDRNGNDVTVLSALARLGFDPWQEASDLWGLPGEAALTRLSSTLSGFKDVPTLFIDHALIAGNLTKLLPERSVPRDLRFIRFENLM